VGDSCYVFGYVADAARTDSIIYALDMSRAQLRKYTPQGEYSGYIGGRGDGPGDLDGNLYMVQRHTPQYRIVCYGSDAVPFDTLSLDLPVIQKTDDEIALEKRHTEEYLTGMGTSNVMQWIYDPDTFKAPIAGIWLGWEGNLWVLRGTDDRPVFDVWSIPEGEYLFMLLSSHNSLTVP